MSVSPGATLHELRERKPLVHQITNYVVMNETADATLAAGKAANRAGVPVVLDPVGAGATTYRTETARRLLGDVDVTVLRGNAGEVATLVGVEAEVRGVESMGVGGETSELARAAARSLGLVASVTGAVDHVSDGKRVLAVANGH